jgi:hypothetical protein
MERYEDILQLKIHLSVDCITAGLILQNSTKFTKSVPIKIKSILLACDLSFLLHVYYCIFWDVPFRRFRRDRHVSHHNSSLFMIVNATLLIYIDMRISEIQTTN